jgi:hypothetical protein
MSRCFSGSVLPDVSRHRRCHFLKDPKFLSTHETTALSRNVLKQISPPPPTCNIPGELITFFFLMNDSSCHERNSDSFYHFLTHSYWLPFISGLLIFLRARRKQVSPGTLFWRENFANCAERWTALFYSRTRTLKFEAAAVYMLAVS